MAPSKKLFFDNSFDDIGGDNISCFMLKSSNLLSEEPKWKPSQWLSMIVLMCFVLTYV